jgi:HlyD family secretion protein
MPAHSSLDSIADQVFSGRVRRIAPYVLEREKQARTVDVEVDFLCSDDCQDMLPGYSADIEIILEERTNTLRIPTETLLEGNKVLVLTPDGELAEHEITTGLSNWAWTEVTAGLNADDRVVTSVDRDGVVDGAAAIADVEGADGD